MSVGEGTRAWLVTALKVALPLIALGVLATLFLFSRDIDPSRALPYASVDVEELIRDPRVQRPRYAGVTDDGTGVTLTAESVRASPAPAGDRMYAHQILAVLEAADGTRSTISAREATLDQAEATLLLEGDVVMHSAAGYDLRTDKMRAALDRTWVESDGGVEAVGPPGRIVAGGMRLEVARQEAQERAEHLLVFTGGVELIYLPGLME